MPRMPFMIDTRSVKKEPKNCKKRVNTPIACPASWSIYFRLYTKFDLGSGY